MHSRIALLTPLFFCGLAAGAHEPMTRITVNVINLSGNPIEHAEVAIRVVKDNKPRTKWRIRTHEDGVVKAPEEIPQGSIEIEVTADEYEPFIQKFDVHEPQKTIEVKMGSAMTRLNIHVTTMGGKPLDHADVVVKFVKGRSIIELGRKLHTTWEMRTNQEGMAKVPEIPRGTILIQVIASGYQTYGKTFEVDELEKTIEVKLNSPQEQYSAH
jgi:5-hydroxyisourate hydrolase-like protein (transthyretin family)